MAEEIIISVSELETRVAVVEQGLLQEVFIERKANAMLIDRDNYVLPDLLSAVSAPITFTSISLFSATKSLSSALTPPFSATNLPKWPPICIQQRI